MTVWHPLFAQLLRAAVEKHYDLQTNVPVGDVPRQADFVLLRRTGTGPLTFQGLWRHLTPWSVLEFKGPTVSPRVRDLDLLVEVGLGIDRRLNEERAKQKQELLAPEEVSFWYVANHLGGRFLRDARERLGPLTEEGSGVWRCVLLQRPLFLVSSVALPVEEDSLPMQILAGTPPELPRQVAEFVIERPALWERYGAVLSTLHHDILQEVTAMGKVAKKAPKFHWKGLFDVASQEEVMQSLMTVVDPETLMKVLPPKYRKALLASMVADLSAAERKHLKQQLE